MDVTTPPSGGSGRNRNKAVKKITGWLILQAIAEGLRRLAEHL
ncbi:hypothetical protein [Streptomyces clavifer]